MDWKLFSITFVSIFLAELGDKTQLATMGFAAQNGNAKWIIFGASASALVITSFLGVVVGNVISNYISPKYIKIGSAILFLVIGIFLLYDAFSENAINGKYEKIESYLKEKSSTHCIYCEKFQNELSKIESEELINKYIEEKLEKERGCPDCSAEKLKKMLNEEEI